MTERELNEAQLKLAQKKSDLEHKRFRSEVLMMAQEAVKESTGVPNVWRQDPDKALVVAQKYMDFICASSDITYKPDNPVLTLIK